MYRLKINIMIRKRTKNYKRPLIIALLAFLGVMIVLCVLQITHTTHFFEPTSSKQKQQETTYNGDKKQTTVSNNGNPSKTDVAGNPAASSGSYTTPQSNSDAVSITPSQQGNYVVLSVKLSGYSDGSCALSITNANTGKDLTRDADVIYAPNFSTCAGFSIPTSSLGAGSWSISLAITSGGITTNKSLSLIVQ